MTADSYLGDINSPPSLHRYMYAWDRPTFWTDPTGHAPGDWYDPRSYVGDNDYARGWRQGLGEGYFENAADIGDSIRALGRGAGNAGGRLATGVVTGAVKGSEQSYKLLLGTPEQKFAVIQEDVQMGKAAVTHLRENVRLLGYGLTHGNDLLNAAADLGISGTSEVLGDATFEAGNVVAAGYGAVRGVQGIAARRAAAVAMDAAHDGALAENAARAAMDAAHEVALAENAAWAPKVPSIYVPGGLRQAAIEAHELVTNLRQRQMSAIALAEVAIGDVTEFWASGSRSLSKVQKQFLAERGITRFISDRFHAEQNIAKALPEGASVRRWGIAWTEKLTLRANIRETRDYPVITEQGEEAKTP